MFGLSRGTIAPKGTVVALPRTDAAAFVAVRRAVGLPLVFSDYAIGVPTYGGAAFTPIPNIRYASDTDWYVHRGTERARRYSAALSAFRQGEPA